VDNPVSPQTPVSGRLEITEPFDTRHRAETTPPLQRRQSTRSPARHHAGSCTRAGTARGTRQSGRGFWIRGDTPASGSGSGSGGALSSGGRHLVGPMCHNSHPAATIGTPKVSAKLHRTWVAAFIFYIPGWLLGSFKRHEHEPAGAPCGYRSRSQYSSGCDRGQPFSELVLL